MCNSFKFGAIFNFRYKKSIFVKVDQSLKDSFYWREILLLDSIEVAKVAAMLGIEDENPVSVKIVKFDERKAFFEGSIIEFSKSVIEELLNPQGYVFLNGKLTSNSVLTSMRFKTVLSFIRGGRVREAVRNFDRYIGSDGENKIYTIELYEQENPDKKLNNSSYVNWVNKKIKNNKNSI